MNQISGCPDTGVELGTDYKGTQKTFGVIKMFAVFWGDGSIGVYIHNLSNCSL